MRVCELCGKSIEGTHPARKYCIPCGPEWTRIYDRRYKRKYRASPKRKHNRKKRDYESYSARQRRKKKEQVYETPEERRARLDPGPLPVEGM